MSETAKTVNEDVEGREAWANYFDARREILMRKFDLVPRRRAHRRELTVFFCGLCVGYLGGMLVHFYG